MVLDPAKRMSAKAALDHDWFWSEPKPKKPSAYAFIILQFLHYFRLPSYSCNELAARNRRKNLQQKQPQEVQPLPPSSHSLKRSHPNGPHPVPPSHHHHQQSSHHYPSSQNQQYPKPHGTNTVTMHKPQSHQQQPRPYQEEPPAKRMRMFAPNKPENGSTSTTTTTTSQNPFQPPHQQQQQQSHHPPSNGSHHSHHSSSHHHHSRQQHGDHRRDYHDKRSQDGKYSDHSKK